MSNFDEFELCPFCGASYKEVFEQHSETCYLRLMHEFHTYRTHITQEDEVKAWNTRYERTCTFEWCVFCEGDSTGEYEAWYCSNCGEVGDELEDVPNHCPYCGAKVVNNE